MNTLHPSHRNHPFLQRLKAFLERSGMHCTEGKMGGTTVLHETRKQPSPPPEHRETGRDPQLPAETPPPRPQ